MQVEVGKILNIFVCRAFIFSFAGEPDPAVHCTCCCSHWVRKMLGHLPGAGNSRTVEHLWKAGASRTPRRNAAGYQSHASLHPSSRAEEDNQKQSSLLETMPKTGCFNLGLEHSVLASVITWELTLTLPGCKGRRHRAYCHLADKYSRAPSSEPQGASLCE